MSDFRLLGTTRDVNDCEECGRSGLARTVRVVALDVDGNPVGDPFYVGTTCVQRFTGWPANKVRGALSAAETRRAVEIQNASDEYRVWVKTVGMGRAERAEFWRKRFPSCAHYADNYAAYHTKKFREDAFSEVRRVCELYGLALPAHV